MISIEPWVCRRAWNVTFGKPLAKHTRAHMRVRSSGHSISPLRSVNRSVASLAPLETEQLTAPHAGIECHAYYRTQEVAHQPLQDPFNLVGIQYLDFALLGLGRFVHLRHVTSDRAILNRVG